MCLLTNLITSLPKKNIKNGLVKAYNPSITQKLSSQYIEKIPHFK